MLPKLVHIDFNITSACNFACAHCHCASGRRNPGELSTDRVLQVIEEAGELNVISMAIAGGEPFIRPDVYDILSHAASLRKMSVAIITNGSLLRSGDLAKIADIEPKITLNISLDGSSWDIFGRLRGRPGASRQALRAQFRRVSEAVRTAATFGINTGVNFTFTNESLEDLDNLYKFATTELGATAVVGIKFFPSGVGKQNSARLDVPWGRWSSFLIDITRKKLAGDYELLQISLPSAWEFYLPLIQAGVDIDAAEEVWNNRSPLRHREFASRRDLGDPLGDSQLAVGEDVILYPSVLLVGERSFACGDLKTGSLRDFWLQDDLLRRIRAIKVRDLDAKCAGCPIVAICGGGSRVRAYYQCGSLTGEDSACPIMHSKAWE